MRTFEWIKTRISHKIKHISLSNYAMLMRKHGVALLIITLGWEIVEDILFPIAFGLLGKYVHPAFYGGIPIAWLLCLHWLAIPILWGAWFKINNQKNNRKHDCHHH